MVPSSDFVMSKGLLLVDMPGTVSELANCFM